PRPAATASSTAPPGTRRNSKRCVARSPPPAPPPPTRRHRNAPARTAIQARATTPPAAPTQERYRMPILHEPTTARTAEVTLPVNLTVELEPTGDGRIAVAVYDESLDPTGTLALDPAWRIHVDGGHEQAADTLRTLADALLRAADAEDRRT